MKPLHYNYNTVNICGIDVVHATRKQFTEFAVEDILTNKTGVPKICFSLNGESLSDFHSNKSFRELFLRADYVHADGMSIVNMSRALKVTTLPERIATTDWFHDLAKASVDKGIRHFFLGAKPEALQKAMENVKNIYPGLQIAGYHHGYFRKNEEKEIIGKINSSNADIIWVALGRPKQEVLSIAWKGRLKVKWIKTCGGLFDFLSQEKTRAPEIMQKLNLEWLYRMSLEPMRLGPRYLKTNLRALFIALRYRFRGK